MAEEPIGNGSRGKLRALYDWLTQATPSPHSSTAPPGERAPARIGRYEILEKLGEGGMGVVYAARDERLARTVALKTMSSLASDESARKRFWREARAAATVNHPNVCQIHEIDEDGGELFLVMELLEGEPLAEKLKRGPLNLSEAVSIGLEVLAALSALHARGRDESRRARLLPIGSPIDRCGSPRALARLHHRHTPIPRAPGSKRAE